MPRPKQGYHLLDGTPVPGVTTILNRFKDTGGIVYWAWSQGKAGKDFRETKDVAASAGILAHAFVEARLRCENVEVIGTTAPKEIYDKAWNAYQNWARWVEQTGLQVEPWEKPIACEHHRFGGTPDALFRFNGLTAVGDWKTSDGGPYTEWLLQLAAYGHLFEDTGLVVAGGYHIGKFSQEHADFSHHHYSELTDAWELFKLLRQAYELDRQLARRVR